MGRRFCNRWSKSSSWVSGWQRRQEEGHAIAESGSLPKSWRGVAVRSAPCGICGKDVKGEWAIFVGWGKQPVHQACAKPKLDRERLAEISRRQMARARGGT